MTDRECDHCGETESIMTYDYRGDLLCHDCYGSVRGLDRVPGWFGKLVGRLFGP